MSGIHEEAPSDRLAAQQHPEAHHVSVREGELDGPLEIQERSAGDDDRAQLLSPPGVLDPAVLVERGLGGHGLPAAALERVHREADPRASISVEVLDVEGVERGRASSGVHLGLDRVDVEVGEPEPFAPADRRELPSGSVQPAPPSCSSRIADGTRGVTVEVADGRSSGGVRAERTIAPMAPERNPGVGSVSEEQRVGILGGTFDPPHRGHLELAVAARDQFALDRVLLVVAGDPWQKRGEVEASADDRLAMVRAAIVGRSRLEVSAIEIERGGPTYTVDTLDAFRCAGRDLYLIVGADVAGSLDTWHRPDRVRELAVLLVAGRPDDEPAPRTLARTLQDQGWRCGVVAMDEVPISSTELRELLHDGADVGAWVSAPVMRVIEERGLYTRRR